MLVATTRERTLSQFPSYTRPDGDMDRKNDTRGTPQVKKWQYLIYLQILVTEKCPDMKN